MLRVNPAIFVEVEATGEVSISSYVSTQATGDNFLLQGSLRAFEGENEVCRRDWDRSIPRDFS